MPKRSKCLKFFVAFFALGWLRPPGSSGVRGGWGFLFVFRGKRGKGILVLRGVCFFWLSGVEILNGGGSQPPKIGPASFKRPVRAGGGRLAANIGLLCALDMMLSPLVVRKNCVGHKFAASTFERKGIISRHPSNRSQIRSFPATDRGAPDIDTRRESLLPFRASQCRQTAPAVRQARRSTIG